jgi:branched-chain amino acid aminotransferase
LTCNFSKIKPEPYKGDTASAPVNFQESKIMPIQERYWHQGEILTAAQLHLSPLNRAFRYGDGLFETILIRKGEPVHFQQHWERMREGMHILGLLQALELEAVHPFQSLVEEVVGKLLIDQDTGAFGRMRLTVYRAGSGAFLPLENTPVLFGEVHPLDQDPWTLQPPRHVCIAHQTPLVYSELSAVKSLNVLPKVMAARHAAAQGFDDALLRSARGDIAECTTSNIFLVTQNRILTPWLGSGCLPGVMRAQVITIAQELGLKPQSQAIQLHKLDQASEIFITNAIHGLQPVASIAETRYAAKAHPVMSSIRDALIQRTDH